MAVPNPTQLAPVSVTAQEVYQPYTVPDQGLSLADKMAQNRLAQMFGFQSFGDALTGTREAEFTQAQSAPAWVRAFTEGIRDGGLTPTQSAAAANLSVLADNPRFAAGYTARQAAVDERKQEETYQRRAALAAALNLPEIADAATYGGFQLASPTAGIGQLGENDYLMHLRGGGQPARVSGFPLMRVLNAPALSNQLGISGLTNLYDARVQAAQQAREGATSSANDAIQRQIEALVKLLNIQNKAKEAQNGDLL